MDGDGVKNNHSKPEAANIKGHAEIVDSFEVMGRFTSVTSTSALTHGSPE